MYYVLRDVNPYHNNCGHYPDWEVVECEGELPSPVPRTDRGKPAAWATREEAAAVAAKRNRASDDAWYDFLNG